MKDGIFCQRVNGWDCDHYEGDRKKDSFHVDALNIRGAETSLQQSGQVHFTADDIDCVVNRDSTTSERYATCK